MNLAGELRVGMVVYGDIALDSRVQREANSLVQAGHSVALFCLSGSRATAPMLDTRVQVFASASDARQSFTESPSPFHRDPGGSSIRAVADRIGWLMTYARDLRAWGRAVTATATQFDVWHAHDFTGLVAVSGSRLGGAALIYDVHDIFTETGTAVRLPRPLRSALRWYERRLVQKVDLAVAVNDGVANVIRARTHPRSMIVVHNCAPAWTPPTPHPTLIREATGIPDGAPVILYHGLLSSDRGLDRLCEAILEPGLEAAHIVMLGFGLHRERYLALAREARFDGRVHVLDPVPPSELMPWVASADVGAMAMPRTTLNLYLSTPNKLFECLAAGVPVVASDFPAMRRIVMGDPLGPLGAVCDPSLVEEIAAALRNILGMENRGRGELRHRCASAARERWNWESQAAVLLAAYAELARSRQVGKTPIRLARRDPPSGRW